MKRTTYHKPKAQEDGSGSANEPLQTASHRSLRLRAQRIFHWLRQPGDRLSQRVVHAGFWAFALRIVNRVFALARTIVLARLLSPNDFGLFGIALLALSTLETFSETGFNAAIIQKKADVRPYLDTAWTVQVTRGFVLAGILLAGAPYVAAFFGEPGAASLVRALALVMVLRGLVNTGVLYFRKELEFHREFVYMFSGTLVDLGVAIPAALILRSAWALIFGLVAGQFVRMVVSYLVHPYRPRLRLERVKAKELYSFGRWIFATTILVFLITQGDAIFVGKLLGATMLGFYQMAYRISNIAATEITHVISQVTFPAYSKLQDSLDRLREAYLKVLQLTAFISIPIAGLMFSLAPEFTKLFLGQKWTPMVPAMMALALAGLVRSISATTGPIFQAVGKPEIITKWEPVRLVVLAALIYPLTARWGILGTSVSVVLSNLTSAVGFSIKVVRTTKCGMRAFIGRMILPIISTVIMILFVFVLKDLFERVGITLFILFGASAALVYLTATCIVDRQTLLGIRELLGRITPVE
jgi:lipopolysaccharide exporter